MSEYYDEEGRPYWSRICPFCGEREAVRFEDGLLRACRVCGAKWLEWRGLVRMIEPKCAKAILASPITGVHHIPWRFAQAQSAEEPKAIETTEEEAKKNMSKSLQLVKTGDFAQIHRLRCFYQEQSVLLHRLNDLSFCTRQVR